MDMVELVVIVLEFAAGMGDYAVSRRCRENRRARRDAKRNRVPPPPRSAWTWAFMALSLLVGALAIFLVIHIALRMAD